MDCVTCALRLEKDLRKVPGVKEADVNLVLEKVTVTYDPQEIDVPSLERKIESLGYRLLYKKHEGFAERIARRVRGSKAEAPPVLREARPNEFEDLIVASLKPTLLWVTSDPCPSCKAQIPSLKRLRDKYESSAYFYQMNVMQARSVKGYEEVDAPTLLLFNRGLLVRRYAGLLDEAVVEERLTELLQANSR